MKNVKRSVLVVCLFALAKMFGQTAPRVHFETMSVETPVEELSYQYLLAHKVFLRDKPSLKAKRLGVLDIGTRMVVREKSKHAQEINGINSNWYRVTVGEATGWVWGGMIAQKAFGSGADYKVKFVYGLESNTVTEAGINETKYQLRAFKDGVQLDKVVLDSLSAFPLGIKNIGNKGLFNVEDIIALDLADLNTGHTIGKSYIFWNNGRFTNVANLRDQVTDAYAKSEYFVFPSDMQGIKSTLELKTTITDKNGTLEKEKIEQRKKWTSSFYTWNGYQLLKKEHIPVISENVVVSTLHR
ncbi:MAG: hypothetical protein Mars2KO_01270 [Maribacter sp.]